MSCHKRKAGSAVVSGLDAEEGMLQFCFLPESAQKVNVSKAREHWKKQHLSISVFTGMVLKIKNYQPNHSTDVN